MTIQYVEDFVAILYGHFHPPFSFSISSIRANSNNQADKNHDWHRNFIASINEQIYILGRSLTTEQAKIVLKLIPTFKDDLVKEKRATAEDLDRLYANPRYAKPLVPSSNVPREVRLSNEQIIFRFKKNDIIKMDLTETQALDAPVIESLMWDWINKCYSLRVTPRNSTALVDIITKHKFDFDDVVIETLTTAINANNDDIDISMHNGEIIVYSPLLLVSQWLRNKHFARPIGFMKSAIPATPANARRVCQISKITPRCKIAKEILELSKEDLIDDVLLGFIIDNNMRCYINTSQNGNNVLTKLIKTLKSALDTKPEIDSILVNELSMNLINARVKPLLNMHGLKHLDMIVDTGKSDLNPNKTLCLELPWGNPVAYSEKQFPYYVALAGRESRNENHNITNRLNVVSLRAYASSNDDWKMSSDVMHYMFMVPRKHFSDTELF